MVCMLKTPKSTMQPTTSSHGWPDKFTETSNCEWVQDAGTSIQPPWSFFANFNIKSPSSMRRLAKYFHYRLNGVSPRADTLMYELEIHEIRELERMVEECMGSPLLHEMMLWIGGLHEGKDGVLLQAVQYLASAITKSARKPDEYAASYQPELKRWENTLADRVCGNVPTNKPTKQAKGTKSGFVKARSVQQISEPETAKQTLSKPISKEGASVSMRSAMKEGNTSEEGGEEEDHDEEDEDDESELEDDDSEEERYLSAEDLLDGDTYKNSASSSVTPVRTRGSKRVLRGTLHSSARAKSIPLEEERRITLPQSTQRILPPKRLWTVKSEAAFHGNRPTLNEAATQDDRASQLHGSGEDEEPLNVFLKTVLGGEGRTTRSGRGYNPFTADGFDYSKYQSAVPDSSLSPSSETSFKVIGKRKARGVGRGKRIDDGDG